MFPLVKFGCSATNEPPKLGGAWGPPPCGRGVDDLREIYLPMCYPAEFGRSNGNGTSVIKEIYMKNLTIVFRLSRSLKVIGTDTTSIRRL